MIINFENKNIIGTKDYYLHDDKFCDFKYNYYENRIIFQTTTEDKSKMRTIIFENVLGFQMLSGDFWGRSPHIFDWELITMEDDDPLLSKIMNNPDAKNVLDLRISSFDKCVESKIYFTSGDTLDIVCEFINYEVTPNEFYK